MKTYVLMIVTRIGAPRWHATTQAATDEDAIAEARRVIVSGDSYNQPVEVWDGKRLVVELAPAVSAVVRA